MIEALFFLPVGPADVQRAAWTVKSIRAHCRDYRIHLLLDGPDAAALPDDLKRADVRIHVETPPTRGHWGRIWLMQCRAMCAAAKDPAVSPRAIFIKIDADALVVRDGLTERAQALFATRPKAGQIGQCFSNIRGERFDNFGWTNYMRKMLGWRGLRNFLRGSIEAKAGLGSGLRGYRDFRALLLRAIDNSYCLGDFAIGGSYVLRRDVIEALDSSGLLDNSPFLLMPKLGEDVVMTPHVYALGYAAIDDVADDGLFGVEGKAFRIDPFMLKARGHYIIHPTKYGHQGDGHTLDEAGLVAALLADAPAV